MTNWLKADLSCFIVANIHMNSILRLIVDALADIDVGGNVAQIS